MLHWSWLEVKGLEEEEEGVVVEEEEEEGMEEEGQFGWTSINIDIFFPPLNHIP